jgi:hypothetical protein
MKCQLLLTKWATPSDEAFTLLALENNWQSLWLEQAKVLFEHQMEAGSRGDSHPTPDPECINPAEDNATVEEKQRKRKGKLIWEKRSKYTSNMNNRHKLQGWSKAGKLRLNTLLMAEVEDSRRTNATCQEVKVGMLEKWRTIKKY